MSSINKNKNLGFNSSKEQNSLLKKSQIKFFNTNNNIQKTKTNERYKKLTSTNPLTNSKNSRISIESINKKDIKNTNNSKEIENQQNQIKKLQEKINEKKHLIEVNKNKLNLYKKDNESLNYELNQKDSKIKHIEEKIQFFVSINNNLTSQIQSLKENLDPEHNRRILEAMRTRRELRRQMLETYLLSMIMNMRERDENNNQYPNVDNMSYEELLALEEQIGNVSKGLDKKLIEKIPFDKYRKNKFPDDKCVICQIEFENNERVKVLPCKHCYHKDCIDEWLKDQKVCPYCKKEVKF